MLLIEDRLLIQQAIDATRLFKRFHWEWEAEESFNELQPLSGVIMAILEEDHTLDDDEIEERILPTFCSLMKKST